eukprot:1256653-Pyramimonas_sp.AAC.1
MKAGSSPSRILVALDPALIESWRSWIQPSQDLSTTGSNLIGIQSEVDAALKRSSSSRTQPYFRVEPTHIESF